MSATSRNAVVALAFAAASMVAFEVQAERVAERPVWSTGDTWLFQRTDGRTGQTSNAKRTIAAVRPDGGYTLMFGDGRAQATDANLEYESDAGPEYKGRWQRWPLAVGDEWEWEVPVRMDAGNGVSVGRRKVVAMESVAVPAGQFDCLRIESTITRMTYDGRAMSRPSYSSTTDFTTWYCPALRQFGKEIVTWRDGYGGYTRSEWVLIRYSLAP